MIADAGIIYTTRAKVPLVSPLNPSSFRIVLKVVKIPSYLCVFNAT